MKLTPEEERFQAELFFASRLIPRRVTMPNSKTEAKEHAVLAAKQLKHATKNVSKATEVVADGVKDEVQRKVTSIGIESVNGAVARNQTGVAFGFYISRPAVYSVVGAAAAFVAYRHVKPLYTTWRVNKATDKAVSEETS